MSGSYNVLKNTWIYQDIRQEAQREIQQQYIEELRRILLAIVQARFPRSEVLVRQLIENRNEMELLQTLIIQIGGARLEKDARRSISRIAQEYMSG